MPHGVLADFAAQMSAIAAQESLRRVSEVAVGSGSLKRADARRTLRQWHREVNRGQGRINHKPRTRQEHHALAAAAGIRLG